LFDRIALHIRGRSSVGERCLRTAEVVGSNPIGSTSKFARGRRAFPGSLVAGRHKATLGNRGIQLTFYLYILRCSDGTYYTGHARDIAKRIKEHNSGKAAKYTSGRLPVELVYCEVHETRSQAAKREYEIKQWSRAKKQALIDGVTVVSKPPFTCDR
jgi:putative endonuclease